MTVPADIYLVIFSADGEMKLIETYRHFFKKKWKDTQINISEVTWHRNMEENLSSNRRQDE